MHILFDMDMGKVSEKIEEMEANRDDWMIERESIEYMVDFIKNNLKNAVALDIGTHKGYSALFFSTVCDRVVTIEIDENWFEESKENLKDIENIECVKGDAMEIIPELEEKFDFILIDLQKALYAEILKVCLSVANKGCFIFCDNTITHREKMKDFFDFLENSDLDWKEIDEGDGMVIVSLK
jgi:predicted O-methyltransferase YrrM